MTVRLDIVTAEKVVYSEEVDAVIAPGISGELGILPHHTNLMTTLQAGELRIRREGEETSLAISGGFLEIRPDRIVVLAESAERDTEIDLTRAEEARKRARERLAHPVRGVDTVRAEAALQRSLARLKVAQKRRRRTLGQ